MRRYTAACMLLASASITSGMALKTTLTYSPLAGWALGLLFTVGAAISYAKGH